MRFELMIQPWQGRVLPLYYIRIDAGISPAGVFFQPMSFIMRTYLALQFLT